MQQVFIDGREQGGGGGGGGGGGTGWNAAWETLLDDDYSALADADILAGGDGARVIAGRTWIAQNTAQMTALAVGANAGGIRIGVGASALEYLDGSRTAAAMALDLAQLFAGSKFEGRNDVELRITPQTDYEGTFTTTPSFENLVIALQAKNAHDSGRRVNVLRGSESSNAGRRRCWWIGVQGTLAVGKQDYSNADLAYFPNILRLSLLENFFVGEFSTASDSEIGDAMTHGITTNLNQSTNLWIKEALAANTLQFAFARRNAANGQLTAHKLVKLRIEARFSPRGIGAFAPTGG